MTDRPVFAAIDIGSNTFRLLIAAPNDHDGEDGAPWRTLHYEHRIVRLGEGLHEHGRLGEPGISRALEALGDFRLQLDRFGVPASRLRAVATAAMRAAANGEAIRRRILREAGLEIAIIDGEEEARLSLAGAAAVLRPEIRRDWLLFDIGGGSTEFVRARETEPLHVISRDLGVVRLVEAHLHSDPPSPSDWQAMKDAAHAHLEAVETAWGGARAPAHLVGTAGTVTTLAATELDLVPYNAEAINNHWMSRAALATLRDRLLAMTHAQRQRIRTIEPGRADLIVAGLAICEAVLERWPRDGFTVVDAGLLEGAWLQAAGRLDSAASGAK
ncbi:MAG: Ppx/GppA family phosphatase [Mariprofundaceae bacterium]